MSSKLSRAVIEELEPYVPGMPVEEVKREYGLKEVIKLASNENPWGISPKAARAVRRELHNAHLYPEGSCKELREALARFHGVEPSMVTVANGADNVLSLIVQGFVEPGDEVVMGRPTFPIYKSAVMVAGGRPVEIPLRDHRLDLEAMTTAITSRTKALFVCNPNNPTGTVVESDLLHEKISRFDSGILWVIDEVYADFADRGILPDTFQLIRDGRPVISVRSFSKLYGLAGLRVGYAIGPRQLIDVINRVREPFTVNRLAQAAALASLEDEEFRRRVLDGTRRGRTYLIEAMEEMGLKCAPSQTNFVLVDTKRDSRLVYEGLLKRGIIVRSGSIWGLESHCRITVGRPRHNRLLLKSLKEVLAEL